MATSTKPRNMLNSFMFSNCSIKHFKENISLKSQYKCLLNVATHNIDYLNLIQFIPGQLYNITEQCVQLYGEKARPL